MVMLFNRYSVLALGLLLLVLGVTGCAGAATPTPLPPTPTATPTPVPLSKVGYSRANPAEIGTALFIKFDSYYQARITLLEAIKGDQARNIVDGPRWLDTGQSNPGFEWVLTRVPF
jgi:hypothetical protein